MENVDSEILVHGCSKKHSLKNNNLLSRGPREILDFLICGSLEKYFYKNDLNLMWEKLIFKNLRFLFLNKNCTKN